MPATAATDADFDSEVLKSDIPVLVDFWAEWCGPCRRIASALDEIGNEFGDRVKIVKIDVDENPNSAASLGVRGLPALFIFKNGDVASDLPHILLAFKRRLDGPPLKFAAASRGGLH